MRCFSERLRPNVNGYGEILLFTIFGDKGVMAMRFSLLYKSLMLWCFLFTVNNTHALDLGQVAQSFPIKEQDFSEMMKNKLTAIPSQQWQVHRQKIIDKTKERINRPQGVRLPRTTKARNFMFDPSITTRQDILDHKGYVLVARGTKANPLDFIRLHQSLLLIDGDDREQVSWGASLSGLLVLVQGEPLKLARKLNRQVYFDQYQKIIQKFGIESVPAKVSQSGSQLVIEEIKLVR